MAGLYQVRFIDPAGLSALVGAANRAAAHDGSLHMVCARPQIRQLFRLTGLDRRLAPARTLDEAPNALVGAGVVFAVFAWRRRRPPPPPRAGMYGSR